jgi:hypothetical protein
VGEFDSEDELWEVTRFKMENISALEKKWEELKLDKYHLNYQIIGEEIKKPQSLVFHFEKVCPHGDFVSKPVTTVSAFSPYSALGACPHCNGYGANLVYDEEKVVDREKTIKEGGLRLLNFGAFHDSYEEFLRICKRKNFHLDVPIKKLPKEFFQILEKGQGEYPGFEELKSYLAGKKYKPSIRIFTRQLQKEEACMMCHQSRLNPDIQNYFVNFAGKNYGLSEIMSLTVEEALPLFRSKLVNTRDSHERRIYTDIHEKLQMVEVDRLLDEVERAGLQRGEVAHHAFDAVVEADGDPVPGLDAEVAQPLRQAVGRPIELGVGHARRADDQRGLVGKTPRALGEHEVERLPGRSVWCRHEVVHGLRPAPSSFG